MIEKVVKVERVGHGEDVKERCGYVWGPGGEKENRSEGHMGGGKRRERGRARKGRKEKGGRKEKRKTAMGTEKERKISTGSPAFTRTHSLSSC